jgi:hypothetical protein
MRHFKVLYLSNSLFVFLDVMECIIELQERIDILRRGFDIARRDNIRLRRQLRESDAENRRLTHVMMNFEF